MSEPSADLTIPNGHQRMVWVFSARMDLDALEALKGDGLGDILGLWRDPDPAHVECFEADAMAEYGLANYIAQANGMAVSDADAATLDALKGPVCLIYSKALAEAETRFAPEPPLTFVGRFGTAPAIPPMSSLESASATGLLPQGKPPKSDARMSGMVATFVLIFLAVFVTAFVLVAG